MIGQVITAIWLVLPSYVPNSTAVLFEGNKPIDLEKRFFDQKRVLGDGKTIRGFLGGTFCGTVTGIFQIILSGSVGLPRFNNNVLIVFGLAIGAMLGDIFFSFIKRRLSLKRGQPFPIIDQIDFLLGSIILIRFIFPNWFFNAFSIDLLLIIFILTPIIHLLVNYIAYKIGKKEEPW